MESGFLIKRAKNHSNHVHSLHAWSFDAQIIDRHLAQVGHVQVRELDQRKRTWTISAQTFWKEMKSREDTNGDLQYYVEDKHWDLFDPSTPDGKPAPIVRTRSKTPPPDLQPRLM